jgi:hypothetical protein
MRSTWKWTFMFSAPPKRSTAVKASATGAKRGNRTTWLPARRWRTERHGDCIGDCITEEVNVPLRVGVAGREAPGGPCSGTVFVPREGTDPTWIDGQRPGAESTTPPWSSTERPDHPWAHATRGAGLRLPARITWAAHTREESCRHG